MKPGKKNVCGAWQKFAVVECIRFVRVSHRMAPFMCLQSKNKKDERNNFI